MIRAIKVVSTYRGRDPRDFTLLAFGGNGPVHAAAIAESLQIPRVIVPPAPGLFSAFGLLDARPEHHAVQTFFRDVAELAERFEQEHERTYGHRATGEPVEIVNLRVVARVEQSRTAASRYRGAPDNVVGSDRLAYFGPKHRSLRTPVINRFDLDRSARRGPFIVEEYDATVVVPPDQRAWLDEFGNIVMEIKEG